MSKDYSFAILDITFTYFNNDIKSFKINLIKDYKDTFHNLLRYYEIALNNDLPPSFYLSSIDPGIGKSLAISCFIKAWKANSFLPAAGIVIATQSLSEIKSFISRAGLSNDSYACVVSDEDMKDSGLGIRKANEAPVIFTTHSMLRSRLADRTFASASEFHFKGSPRALRIWDESFLIAEPATATVNTLAAIADCVRIQFSPFSEMLTKFARQLSEIYTPCLIKVPVNLRYTGYTILCMDPIKHFSFNSRMKDTLEALVILAGEMVRVERRGGKEIELAIVGCGKALPADLAPLFISDASIRVRDTY